MRRKGVLRKKAVGRVAMERKQEVMVLRIGKPFEAFSIIALLSQYLLPMLPMLPCCHAGESRTYRSIIVITGQVNAPAVTALATSTPNRGPKRSVFQTDLGPAFPSDFLNEC